MPTKAARRRADTHLIYYTILIPQMMWAVVPVHAVPGPSRCKIRGQDKRKHFTEHEIPINLKEESKNRPLEASTHAYLLLTPAAHVTLLQKIKTNLTIIIETTGIAAMLFRFQVQVQVRVERHLRPYFLGMGIAIGP